MDALELLKEDHDMVRGLFEDFRVAAESGKAEAMGSLQERIFAELKIHTTIEEEVFYPAVRKAGGGDLHELTDESVEEHHVVDLLIDEIEALSPDDPAFKAKMTVLMENVEHHASEEEDEMFPEVRELLGQDRLDALGTELEQAKSRYAAKERSKEDLYQAAKEQGIEGRSSMSKEELAEAVEDLPGS